MSAPGCVLYEPGAWVTQAGHHLLSLVGIRASSPWPRSSLGVRSPHVTPVPPSHTFASGPIRADNFLIVVFAQSLIDLSSHPDLCINMQEARHRASLQSLPLAQHYLPRGSGVPAGPGNQGRRKHEKVPS